MPISMPPKIISQPQFGAVRLQTGDRKGTMITYNNEDSPADGLFIGNSQTALLQKPEFNVSSLLEKLKTQLNLQNTTENTQDDSLYARAKQLTEDLSTLQNADSNEVKQSVGEIRQQIMAGFKTLTPAEWKQLCNAFSDPTDIKYLRIELEPSGIKLPRYNTERMADAKQAMSDWFNSPIKLVKAFWNGNPLEERSTLKSIACKTLSVLMGITLPIVAPVMGASGFIAGYFIGN